MYQRIITPVDGSRRSWEVASAAADLAERWDCPLQIVSVVRFDSVREQTRDEIDLRIADLGWHDHTSARIVVGMEHSVGEYIARVANSTPGGLIVMGTTGHGRSAALLGSTAEEIVRRTTTPVLLYGPDAPARAPAGGSIVVAFDGSELSEQALGLAGAWSVGLDATPWVVTVGAAGASMPIDASESATPHAAASKLQTMLDRPVQFETLRGDKPALALIEFAESIDSAVLVETTHARRGFERFLEGSVTMETVHHAHIPVLVVRGVQGTGTDLQEMAKTRH